VQQDQRGTRRHRGLQAHGLLGFDQLHAKASPAARKWRDFPAIVRRSLLPRQPRRCAVRDKLSAMSNSLRALRAAGLALTLGLLGACGQYGPLYLPERPDHTSVQAKKPPPRQAPPPAPPSSPAPGN
jgi:predicted small lipoprotein YifL